jgi:hypothetical protein
MAIDYDKPWGWSTGSTQPAKNKNSIAPLASSEEGAPGSVTTGPDPLKQAGMQVAQKVGMKAVDQGIDGYSKYQAAQALPVGEVVDATGGAATAVEGVANTGAAGAAGEAAGGAVGGVAGPVGAAAGGVMKGEYDEAAGAAVGSVVGAYFGGPVGAMIGSKAGGYVGNYVGSAIGLEQGTTAVPAAQPTGGKGTGGFQQAFSQATGGGQTVGQAPQPVRFSNAPKNYYNEFSQPGNGPNPAGMSSFRPGASFTTSLQQTPNAPVVPGQVSGYAPAPPVWGPLGGGGPGSDGGASDGAGGGAQGSASTSAADGSTDGSAAAASAAAAAASASSPDGDGNAGGNGGGGGGGGK